MAQLGHKCGWASVGDPGATCPRRDLWEACSAARNKDFQKWFSTFQELPASFRYITQLSVLGQVRDGQGFQNQKRKELLSIGSG